MIASGSRHDISIVPEVVYGVTPATPGFKKLRYNSTTLALDKGALQSAEIRSDRQIASFRHGLRSVSGDIVSELSYGSLDDLLAAAFMGAWTGDVLKSGLLRPSFSVERHFADIAQYIRFTGCEVNTFAMTVSPGAIINCTFGLMGNDSPPATTVAIVGATYVAPTTTDPMTGLEGGVAEAGTAITVINEIAFSLANNLNAINVVGSAVGLEPSVGKSNATGTITTFFQDATLYNKFVNEVSGSIQFTLTDPAGNSYVFFLPNVKYNAGPIPVSNDGPVTIAIPFQALFDATTGTNVQVTRAAHA